MAKNSILLPHIEPFLFTNLVHLLLEFSPSCVENDKNYKSPNKYYVDAPDSYRVCYVFAAQQQY
jgi:hypothetical protein